MSKGQVARYMAREKHAEVVVGLHLEKGAYRVIGWRKDQSRMRVSYKGTAYGIGCAVNLARLFAWNMIGETARATGRVPRHVLYNVDGSEIALNGGLQ